MRSTETPPVREQAKLVASRIRQAASVCSRAGELGFVKPGAYGVWSNPQASATRAKQIVLGIAAVPTKISLFLTSFARERTPQSLAATVLKVLVRLRVRPTELMAINEPTAIRAAISPYSIAVTPLSSLISLVSKITIDRLSAGLDHGQPAIKSLINR
jgi:hypothetical protein